MSDAPAPPPDALVRLRCPYTPAVCPTVCRECMRAFRRDLAAIDAAGYAVAPKVATKEIIHDALEALHAEGWLVGTLLAREGLPMSFLDALRGALIATGAVKP